MDGCIWTLECVFLRRRSVWAQSCMVWCLETDTACTAGRDRAILPSENVTDLFTSSKGMFRCLFSNKPFLPLGLICTLFFNDHISTLNPMFQQDSVSSTTLLYLSLCFIIDIFVYINFLSFLKTLVISNMQKETFI